MARNLKNYNICSKCRSSTLRELINTKIINPDIFENQTRQIKKNENFPNSHTESRSKPEEENLGAKTGDADNQFVENNYKRRFVEDDIIARDSVNKNKRGLGCPYG